MRISLLLANFIEAQNWSSLLPQFNTGRVYALDLSVWSNIRKMGPVCFGSREYKINDASPSSRTSKFGDKVCWENGFGRKANFVGDKDSYFEFMREWYGEDVSDYFKIMYADDQKKELDFLIGGAKCRGKMSRSIKRSCDLINYSRTGGNCIESSTLFIHCPGPLRKVFNQMKGSWTEWDRWSYCPQCGESQTRFRGRLCRDRQARKINNVLCDEGEAFQIKSCPPCKDYSDYYYDYKRSSTPVILEGVLDLTQYRPCTLPQVIREKLNSTKRCDGWEKSFTRN